MIRRRRPPLDDEAWFEEAVRDTAVQLSAVVVRYDPAGEVQLSGAHLAGTVDLRNVRQLCRQRPREQWPALVLEHLAGLSSAQAYRPPLDDLDAVRPFLRSRLYGEAEFLLSDVTCRLLAPGVTEALVVVTGGVIGTVPRRVSDAWERPLDELMTDARAAVLADGLPAARPVDVGGGVTLTAVESASFFTTSALFWLDRYVGTEPHGALVAVPNRHLLLAHPVAGPAVLDAVEAMLVNAVRFHEEGPGSLSPHLYWWRSGSLVLLPARLEADRIEFSPPREFVDVLGASG